MKIATLFVPKALKTDRRIYRSASLIIAVDLFILAFSSLFLLPVFYYYDYTWGVYAMTFASSASVLFIFIMYYIGNLDLCGYYFTFCSWVVFTLLLFTSGGITSPFLIWFLTIPTIGLLYMKNKTTYFWSALSIGTVVLAFLLQLTGHSFANELNAQLATITAFFSFGCVLVLFIAVVKSFQTGFQRMTSKLGVSNAELKKSNAELERFAYIASHDLKSPLRNIVSFINLFNRKYANQLDDTGKEYINFVSSSARQMHALIEDILEYSKTSNQEFRREKVDLNKLILLISQQIKSDELYENAVVYTGNMPIIQADAGRMQQLFQNFIENGLKYNEAVAPKVKISSVEHEQELEFIIQDNGIGIAPEFKEQIFEMFRRLHNQEKYTGTGIGLAICKKIIGNYEGTIRVVSEQGEGTAFHLIFPKANFLIHPSIEVKKGYFAKEILIES